MFQRTIGIDLAVRGDHVAQIFDYGQPVGTPIRFRLTPQSLRPFLDKVRAGLPDGAQVQAVLEPIGMAWFPVALWLTRAGIGVIRVKGQRVEALRRLLEEVACRHGRGDRPYRCGHSDRSRAGCCCPGRALARPDHGPGGFAHG
jgi:hypothetical protein